MLTPQLQIVAVSDAYFGATMTERKQIARTANCLRFPDNPNDLLRNLRASLEQRLKNRAPNSMPVQKYDIRRPASERGGFEERYWRPANFTVVGNDSSVEYIIHWNRIR